MLAVRLGAHVALLPLPRSDSALGGSARGAGDPGSTALGELVLKRGLELWLRSPGRGFDYQSHPAIVDDQPSELVAPRWLLKYAPANAWVLDAGAPGEARRDPACDAGAAGDSQQLAFALPKLVAKWRADRLVDGA